MRRNYSYWLVLWGALLFGIEARGQELLDTLWTLRFESPGNESIQGIKLDDDGNLIMIMTHNGLWGTPAGRDFIKISPDMEVLRQRRLPGDFGASISDFREIADGRIEALSWNDAYWLAAENDSTSTAETFEDHSYYYSGPYGWSDYGHRAMGGYWWADSVYMINGFQWAYFDLPGMYSRTESNFVAIGEDVAFQTPNGSALALKYPYVARIKHTGDGIHHIESAWADSVFRGAYEADIPWPQGATHCGLFAAPPTGFYLVTVFASYNPANSPFIIRRLALSLTEAWAHEFPPPATLRPLTATARSNGDIVLLSPMNQDVPFFGLRLVAFGWAYGQLEGDWSVAGGDSATPSRVWIGPDSAVTVLASVAGVGNSRDYVLFHTSPLDYPLFVPADPVLTQVYSDSSRWGYRFETGFFSTQTLRFDGLCSRASAYVTGADSANWSVVPSYRAWTFVRNQALQSNSTVDTFWIAATDCYEGDIFWSSNGGGGVASGPSWFAPVVGQFFIREESYGVSIRFEIQGQSGAYAIELWRKPGVAGDSMIVGTVASLPGMYTIADEQVEPGNTYTYYPSALDSSGHRYPLMSLAQTFTTNEGVLVPDSYYLDSPFPNPFNSQATFRFGLPDAGNTELKVYDITGRLVETLFDGYKQAGTYEYQFDAPGLASGIYFYSFTSGGFAKYGKVALVR